MTSEGLESILTDVKKLIPNVNIKDSITQYCGLRPNRVPEGLNVDMYDDLKGYVNLSGVRSTGITLSQAMGKYVLEIVKDSGLNLEFKSNFINKRKGITFFHTLSQEEQDKLLSENPLYGHVICRCETITEGEIVDALTRPLGARSMDAVKRRVRAGAGRCQGGFCGPRVIEIIARELNISIEEVNKNISGSYMISGKTR